jgi:hypothetical protein
MGCFGGGGSTKQTTTYTLGPEGQQLYQAAAPGAAERLARAGEAYTGELTAGLSKEEQTGLATLDEYLASAPSTESPLYKAGVSELQKTLGGEEYDPIGGAYYQAYRNQVMRELQDAKDRLAASTSARDKFFGGGRIKETSELEEGALGNLQTVLAQLYENERTRRLGAVPEALSYAQYGELVPMGRVAAAEQYGALPREVEQAGLSAKYTEWLRQLSDLGIPLDTALALASKTGTSTSAGTMEQGTNWGNIAGMGLMLALMGGLGGGAAGTVSNPMATFMANPTAGNAALMQNAWLAGV